MKTDTTIPQHPSWIEEGETLRCLTPEDRPLHEAMSRVIYEALPSKELLIPMTPEEYDDTYTDTNEDVVYGVFREGRLIATCSLLHDVRAYAVNPELEDILKYPCIEIGECMVLPEYRGRSLMLHLNKLIKAEARRQGVCYMLATAHPDNKASNDSLRKLGYRIMKEFTRAGKRRNLLLLDLKEGWQAGSPRRDAISRNTSKVYRLSYANSLENLKEGMNRLEAFLKAQS